MKIAIGVSVLLALVLAGCGGSGSGIGTSNRTPTQTTRNNVAKTGGLTLKSVSHSGANIPMFFGPKMGMGGPGMRMPMIGDFILHHAPPDVKGDGPMTGRARTRGDDPNGGGGSTDPGPDPGDPPVWNGFYYDDYLQLWVQQTFADNVFRLDFFSDEAKTQAAGHMQSTWPSDWTTYPIEWRSDYEFTAGALAGSHGSYLSTMTSETAGSMTYDALWGGDRSQGQSTWNESGSSWTNRFTGADGSWSNDSGTFAAAGGGTMTSENSLGYRTRFTWNADGSGDARLEGPDAGLPATIVWNTEGVGTITYADGTTEEFRWWKMVDGGTGPGTGGGGGHGDGGNDGGTGDGDTGPPDAPPPPRK